MAEIKPITGTTQMIAQLADPVVHVRASAIMNDAFAGRGLDWIMHPMHVKPENLADTVAVLRKTPNYIALTTTIPHKREILKFSDEVMPNARLCGASNVTKIVDGRLISEIFDGIGMVSGMARNGVSLGGRRILLCGAGGAGRAIAFAICAENPSCVHVYNRSDDKARDLVEAMQAAFAGLDLATAHGDPAGYDVVINATSLGLKEGDPLPLDMSRISPETDVACVIAPRDSETILAARSAGCRVVPGIEMMKAQVDAMTDFIAAR